MLSNFKFFSILIAQFTICLLFSSYSFAQSDDSGSQVARIDSINALPYTYITTNPQESADLFIDNMEEAEAINYTFGVAKSAYNLGMAYSFLGEEDLELQYRQKAVRMYEEMDSTRLAGYTYAEMGYGMRRRDLQMAESFMRKGLALLEEYPGSVTQADAFNNYAVLKMDMEEYDSALVYTNASLDIKRAKKDTLGISYGFANLANIFVGFGKPDSALEYHKKSLVLRKQAGDSSGVAISLVNLALVHRMKDDIPNAVSNFRRSLDAALALKYTPLAEYNYQQLSSVFEAIGQHDSALVYYKQYTAYKDSILNADTNEKLAELQVQFETEEKERQIAEGNLALSRANLEVRNRTLFLVVAIFGVGIFVLLFLRQRTKQKNERKQKELELEITRKESEISLRKEKERISRDLHDNVGSQITNLITGIEISNMHIEKGQQEKAGDLLKNLDEDARNTMTDLRETIWLLDKEQVRFEDFEKHLRSYIRRQSRYLNGLEVIIESSVEDELILNPSQSLNLMRIIQEALNNTRKYAEARQVVVSFDKNGSQFSMSITDDGEGMNIEEARNSGNGLKNMASRAEEIEAKFEIFSTLQKGTKIELSFTAY